MAFKGLVEILEKGGKNRRGKLKERVNVIRWKDQKKKKVEEEEVFDKWFPGSAI